MVAAVVIVVAEVPERFACQQAVVGLTGLRVLAGAVGAEGFPIVRGSDVPLQAPQRFTRLPRPS